jgi:hypothetical protein
VNGQAINVSFVDSAWSNNSINVTVFRKNSIASFNDTQFIAFYSADRHMVIAKRNVYEDHWTINTTRFTANTDDAHNIISLIIDGGGYVHLAWDHHNSKLRYCKSVSPLSLELGPEQSMTGELEQKITYPEFYKLKNGNLIFLYRAGESGNGNLVMKSYNLRSKKWKLVQSNLIDGEGIRNAYWQACVDVRGTIHLSWVWRESPDVASNHDLCYAKSDDGGVTWKKSTNERYILPINEATAEYVTRIEQHHELINQTSMTADENGLPFIASYWREDKSDIPQYHIAYLKETKWKIVDLGFRQTGFSLSGGGTKRIPISRPQIVASALGNTSKIALIFRDQERGEKISVAVMDDILKKETIKISDLTSASVGAWEPTLDSEAWKKKQTVYLFVQQVEQIDGEGKTRQPGTPIYVMEWKPFK